MMKAVEFYIGADFGIFRRHDRPQDKSLTFNFMPKTAVLGVCGAILGLEGYKNPGEIPQFLKLLGDFKIALAPVAREKDTSGTYPVKRTPFHRTTVTFNNYHGYGNADGNGIYSEQVLIQPGFLITILAEDNNSYLSNLHERLRSGTPEFRPYLGKNEFIAETELIGIHDAIECGDEIIECKSIYTASKNNSPGKNTNYEIPSFLIIDEYPHSFDNYGRYICMNFCFSDGSMPRTKADLSTGAFYRVGKKIIYIF